VKSEFLDLVDLGGVTISVETAINGVYPRCQASNTRCPSFFFPFSDLLGLSYIRKSSVAGDMRDREWETCDTGLRRCIGCLKLLVSFRK